MNDLHHYRRCGVNFNWRGVPTGPVPVERMFGHYNHVTPKSYSPIVPT